MKKIIAATLAFVSVAAFAAGPSMYVQAGVGADNGNQVVVGGDVNKNFSIEAGTSRQSFNNAPVDVAYGTDPVTVNRGFKATTFGVKAKTEIAPGFQVFGTLGKGRVTGYTDTSGVGGVAGIDAVAPGVDENGDPTPGVDAVAPIDAVAGSSASATKTATYAGIGLSYDISKDAYVAFEHRVYSGTSQKLNTVSLGFRF